MSYDFVMRAPQDTYEMFEGNQTYNLSTMFKRAGFHPNAFSGMDARTLRPIVDNAVRLMEDNPEYFKKYNPDNGWGSYEGAVNFLKGLQGYLALCPSEYILVVT